jgi:SulP family sulfate permease
MMGGIPATAALARTSLNINSGATSRVSGVINACSVLLIAATLLPLFKYLPLATVASLLMMISIRMVALNHLTHMWLYDKSVVSFLAKIR